MADKNSSAGSVKQTQGKTVRKLIHYMKPWWGLFIVIAVLSLAGAVFSVLAPGYMQNIVNEIEIVVRGACGS